MRGTFTFKPLKANLTHNTEWITKMDPYCSFTLGSHKFKSQICKSGGKNPVWNDEISVPIDTDQQFCYLQLLDQDRLTKDDNIGTATIDLFEVMNNTNRFVSKWYPVFYKNKSAGEVLIEISFCPNGQNLGNQPFTSGTQNVGYGQSNLGTQGYGQNIPLSTGQSYGQGGLGQNIGQTGYSQGQSIGQPGYGYSQSGTSCQTGYSGQNIPLGTNLGSQQGSNLGYQQGGNIGYQQGTLGKNIDQGNIGQGRFGKNNYGGGVDPSLGQKLGQNLGVPHDNFTQPGYH